ncbi:phytanoyl-CoA dioxygenase family protein [Paenibacillus mendelii]|uniref:Phytanoyl-CoA dioxygenase family protein n=1 Tax=Paenibacillus mendelii TaxID=206163 RepID=A0ABV6J684_9BACL|nr:phytanoyl-CoA dioxygenase family protein [Paenibacillus mendelii]MCQ6561236.1 phytanoyl-CoA dioxygenase family protein [Paenibacillus mendelii]
MLTAKQRFLMDTYGYVVVPNLVEADLMNRVRQAMDRMDQELAPYQHGEPWPVGKPRKITGTPYFSKFGPCIQYDPSFLEIAMHPQIMSCAQDIVGGPVRYEEQECSINSKHPDDNHIDVKKLGWHRGIGTDYSVFKGEGRKHYLWIKAIVFLTDIGPDDGGTSVIPGTQSTGTIGELVPDLEPWMVHRAQGSAGSVLFFSEALIHSVTPILSDKKRYIMITGYVPPFMREYEHTDAASSEFLETVGEEERIFLTGENPKRDRYSYRRL